MMNIMSAISQGSMHAADVAWNMKVKSLDHSTSEKEETFRIITILCFQLTAAGQRGGACLSTV